MLNYSDVRNTHTENGIAFAIEIKIYNFSCLICPALQAFNQQIELIHVNVYLRNLSG